MEIPSIRRPALTVDAKPLAIGVGNGLDLVDFS